MRFSGCLLAFWLACGASLAMAETPREVRMGQVLREGSLHGLLGPDKKLSALRGKPLLINVWASWCGPCRQEMGSLDNLSQRFSAGKFNVIGISTDDYRERAVAFLQKSKTTFPNFLDDHLFWENMLGADRLPLTLLVDADGRVLGKFYGARAWDSPEALGLISRSFKIQL